MATIKQKEQIAEILKQTKLENQDFKFVLSHGTTKEYIEAMKADPLQGLAVYAENAKLLGSGNYLGAMVKAIKSGDLVIAPEDFVAYKELQNKVLEQNKELDMTKKDIENLNDTINAQDTALEMHMKSIEDLNSAVAARDGKLQDLELQTVVEQENASKQINELKQELNSAENVNSLELQQKNSKLKKENRLLKVVGASVAGVLAVTTIIGFSLFGTTKAHSNAIEQENQQMQAGIVEVIDTLAISESYIDAKADTHLVTWAETLGYEVVLSDSGMDKISNTDLNEFVDYTDFQTSNDAFVFVNAYSKHMIPAQISVLNSEIKDLKSQIQENQAASNETISSLQNQLLEKSALLEKAELDLAAANQEVAKLQGEVATYESKIAELNETIATLKTDAENKEAEIIKCTALLNDTQAALDEANSKLEEYEETKAALDEAKAELEEARRIIAELTIDKNPAMEDEATKDENTNVSGGTQDGNNNEKEEITGPDFGYGSN